jgi:hypothetical protein
MARYQTKRTELTAITFQELVEHGRAQGVPLYNGMPWSFTYGGQPITHESDTCYLIPTPLGTMKLTPADLLVTDPQGQIYPCQATVFLTTYEPLP